MGLKISEMTPVTKLENTDLFEVSTNNGTATKSCSMKNIKDFVASEGCGQFRGVLTKSPDSITMEDIGVWYCPDISSDSIGNIPGILEIISYNNGIAQDGTISSEDKFIVEKFTARSGANYIRTKAMNANWQAWRQTTNENSSQILCGYGTINESGGAWVPFGDGSTQSPFSSTPTVTVTPILTEGQVAIAHVGTVEVGRCYVRMYVHSLLTTESVSQTDTVQTSGASSTTTTETSKTVVNNGGYWEEAPQGTPFFWQAICPGLNMAAFNNVNS